MSERTACTAAVAGQDADGGWQLLGGGVCVRVASQAFLLSAGPVLASVSRRAWLGAAGRIVPLYGAAVLGGGPGAPPETRALNIGFAPLLMHDLAAPEALACIPLDAVDLDDGPAGDDYVAIAPDDAAATVCTANPARGAPPAAYRACGVDTATHVVVDVDGAPPPAGLLGCGVWRRHDGAAGDLLTGLAVALRPIEGGARTRIVATRAPFAVLGILGFLGVRPDRGLPKRPRGRAARRSH
jgi:hypothetical protein